MIYLLICASFATVPTIDLYDTTTPAFEVGRYAPVMVDPIHEIDNRSLLGLAPQTDWAAEFAEVHPTEQDYATALRVRFAPYLDR